MSGRPTQRMLFKHFEIRAATGEMAGMHGVIGIVTEVYWDRETHKYRYVLRLDKRQTTPRLSQAVANFLRGESDRPCTVPCGVAFPRASRPPKAKQCLVCAKRSTYIYPAPNEDNGPLLPYCSPACLELHKARHELETLIIAGQDALPVESLTQAFGSLDLTDSVIEQYKQRLRVCK